MKPRSEKATPGEQLRYAALKSMLCICCRKVNKYAGRPDIQHITSGGRRIGNEATYPICKWHHQSYIPVGFGLKNSTEATEMFGPSFAKSKREFEEFFGTEEQLLAQTNKYLGVNVNESETPG